MKKGLRIGIVGTGAMAEYHARRFSAIEDVSIVAVVDRDPGRAAGLAVKAGIPTIYHDVEELAASGTADAVAISSRDLWHAESSIAALSRGLAVFCEKPMARKVAEAEAMFQAAQASGLHALVNFSKRNGGLLDLTRNLIDSGKIGHVETAEFFYLQDWLHNDRWGNWKTTPRWQWRLDEEQSAHGVLGDLASHCIDAMLFLFGSAMPQAASSRRFMGRSSAEGWPAAGSESDASALLDCGNVEATLSVSYGSRSAIDAFGFRIRGTLGDIVVNHDVSRDELSIVSEDGSSPRGQKAGKSLSTYERFVSLALHGTDPLAEDPVDFRRGLEVARLTEALAVMADLGGLGGMGIDIEDEVLSCPRGAIAASTRP
ncbi:MAG TPA: Gfo/Idh/MocA family oxidoreductase [Rectinemataceae bacterium]|nr:Gfo/Idh/MocA family oxidoreductase [Rectinemataceae bacterium]